MGELWLAQVFAAVPKHLENGFLILESQLAAMEQHVKEKCICVCGCTRI